MNKSDRMELKSSVLDKRGYEVNNPKPLFIPVDGRPSLRDRIKRMIRQELSDQAFDKGFETFEQSNDFDMDDEFETDMEKTSYQMQDEILSQPPPESPEQVPQSGKSEGPSGSEVSEPPKGGETVSETPSEVTDDPQAES